MSGNNSAPVASRLPGWIRTVPWALIIALTFFSWSAVTGIYRFGLERGAGNADSTIYENITKNWVATGVYGEERGVPNANITPGYPAFLAPFYAAADATDPAPGGPYEAIMWAQVLVGLGFIYLTWRLANLVATRMAADIAALLLGLSWMVAREASVLLTSMLAGTLLLAYLLVLAHAYDRKSWQWGIAAGLLFGAAAMVRPTIAIMGIVPLVLGVSSVLRPSIKVSGAAAGGLAAVLSAWAVRNAISLGELTLITGRSHTVLAGIDMYFRAANPQAVSGPSASADTASMGVSPYGYAWYVFKTQFAQHPVETLGWFTIGKYQYLAFAEPPAGATLSALDAALKATISAGGLFGLALAWRWRDLLPVAAMVLVWLAQSVIMVPDQRYLLDIYPYLAILFGALFAAAWGRTPIKTRADREAEAS